MSAITEIRKLTGLSHAQLAEWLAVSKSLVIQTEKGERYLPSRASQKINAVILLVEQLKQEASKAGEPAKAAFSNPAKLAERHKQKMEYHRRSAQGLQIQLRRLKARHPQLNARYALFDAMKNADFDWYRASEGDKKWMEIIEWFSDEKLSATGLEQQELLQDKIEMHLAYAELHRERWERFEGMGEQKRLK